MVTFRGYIAYFYYLYKLNQKSCAFLFVNCDNTKKEKYNATSYPNS